MANFFIGIGGTGQMVALVYWRLMALIPWCKPAEMFFMDKDTVQTSNGHTIASLIPGIKSIDPLPPVEGIKTFRDLFYDQKYSNETSDILSALFTSREERTQIDKGMYARPAVGASVLKAMLASNVGDKYRKMMSQLNDGGQHNIVICGSSMGGTGAGGVPSLAQHISQDLENAKTRKNVRINIIYLLKHFNIEDINENKDTIITRDQVIQNSESGLCYLADKIVDGVDTCLLLGLENLPAREYQEVGSQMEQSSIIHMLAALVVHNSQFPNTFPVYDSRLYAYALNNKGISIENIRLKLSDNTEISMSQLLKMHIAIEAFLKYFRNLMVPLPEFSFWPVFPRKFDKCLSAISRVANKDKRSVAKNIGKSIFDESKNIKSKIEFFKDLFASTLADDSSKYIIDSENFDINANSSEFEKAKDKPVLFIRKWLSDLCKDSKLSEIKTEEQIGDEIVKALYRTINRAFFSNKIKTYL